MTFTGRRHTEATKRKISLAKKGKPLNISPEVEAERRRKIGDANRGRPRPDLAERNRGRQQTEAITQHGHSRNGAVSPTYNSWHSMIQRCTNPNIVGWERYGGRGITVCDRWLDFAAFLSDMGDRPGGTSLDRIDNDGDYTPENCRWATREVQNRHRERDALGRFI